MNRELEPKVRAHFQPAAGDSVYIKPNYPAIRICYTDNLTETRTVYGDIAYPKSWCGFKHPRGSSAAYTTWREQIKAYMIARPLDPGRLTESQVDSIISFVRGLLAVRERIELKRQHDTDEVWELIWHLKIVVKGSAKKLQTSNKRQGLSRLVVATLRNLPVSVIHLYSLSPALTGVASGAFRFGFPVFSSVCENPYGSSNGSAGCRASFPRPSLMCKRFGPGNRLGGPGYLENQGSAPDGKRVRR